MNVDSNAVLLAIYEPGAVDRRGDASTAAGDAVWEGRQPVYLKRKRVSATEGFNTQTAMSDRRTSIEIDQMIVRGHLPVQLTPGDQKTASVVLIEDQRDTPEQKTFRVSAVERPAIGSPVDSVRVNLEDARTPA